MAKISAQNDIQQILTQQLGAYTDEIAAQVKAAVTQTANDAAETLKSTSPGTRYRRGWKAVTREENASYIVVGVQNSSYYRLTHLLENPHRLRNGRMTAPSRGFGGRVHIAPVESQAAAELESKIEQIISEAGK